MAELPLQPDGAAAALLTVRAAPKSGRDGVEGLVEDGRGGVALKVRVTAAPSDGAANVAIVKVVAKAFGLPKSAVTIQSGDTARIKRLRLAGDPQDLRARLEALLSP